MDNTDRANDSQPIDHQSDAPTSNLLIENRLSLSTNPRAEIIDLMSDESMALDGTSAGFPAADVPSYIYIYCQN